MKDPAFIHKKDDYLERVAKHNTDIRLLAQRKSLEVMKQKIAHDSSFYLDSAEEWQGFEFVYLLKGKMKYVDSTPPVELEAGDYISRSGVPRKSWFETKTDVTLLYTSTQPAFHLLREEIEDYLRLAREIEATERMEGHSKRLVRMSNEVGKRMGLSTERLAQLKYASFFHDIGKAKVPDYILEKEGKLTEREWKIMKKHTKWGRETLESSDHLRETGKLVEQTHERPDGKGYPKGLEGEEIALEAKIVAVVDAWDAMRTDRPYRDALSKEEAIAELKENKGGQFDAQVVETFLNVLSEGKEIEADLDQRDKYKDELIHLRQREGLFQLSQQILSSESVEEIMEITLQAVIDFTSFRRAIISIFDEPIDPRAQHPRPALIKHYDHQGLTKEEEKKLEESAASRVKVNQKKFDPRYRLGRSYYVPHKDRQKHFDEDKEITSQLEEEETLDWHPADSLYIPLYREDEIIGQISVDDPEDGLVPDEENLQPIESFASLASLGMEKISRTTELEKHKEKLEVLHRLTEALKRREGMDALLNSAFAQIKEVLNFDYIAFFLREGDRLAPKHSFPPDRTERAKLQKLGRLIGRKTLARGEPLWGNLDELEIELSRREKLEASSIISLPLGEQGNLQIISVEEGQFDEEELKFAEIFVDRLQGEIERTELVELI